ncbi:MAG: dephospho-CoA kinase [Rhodospirillaceae bacterium]|nr:dephospho-CoA kinase [Rhodospirillaceae bacterium]
MSPSPISGHYSGPLVLGLTGGIGMGKTWAALAFRHFAVPVFDSDKSVHKLLGPNGAAVAAVIKKFPSVGVDNKTTVFVDRKKLGDIVFSDVKKLRALEGILHPLVEGMQKAFIAGHARRRTRLVVLDVPLLFETGGETKTDYVACVYAPQFVQRPRVLIRPGMSAARLDAIEKNQFSPELKCQLADFVISTRSGRGESLRQVKGMIKLLNGLPAHVWGPAWGK